MKIKLAMFTQKINKILNLQNLYYKIFLIFFIVANFSFIVLQSNITGNIYVEIIRWLQFIFVLFFLSYILKKYYTINIVILFILYFIYFIFAFFFITTKTYLSLDLLIKHSSDLNLVLKYYFFIILILFIFAFLNSLFIYLSIYQKKNINNIKYKKLLMMILLLLLVLPQFPLLNRYNNNIIAFAKTAIHNENEILDYYKVFYNNLIKKSEITKSEILDQTKTIDKNTLPKYLNNIIILQIESLNSFLVNKKNTPNLIKLSKEGIFFPKFYGNSVQTLYGQENMLCSLPSPIDLSLVQSNKDKNILCLPEILNNLGYYSFFFKSYNLDFTNTGEFMRNIKFNEVHADDIMSSSDPQYQWGYREDVFYEKVFKYLEKNKKQNNFLYIEIGPTNHWPFHTPKKLVDLVPFKNPKNHQERLINTTYIQDTYLEEAKNKIDNLFPEKNYTLIIVGDHSWPAEFHKNNTFNQRGSYEENFLTSMVVILGDEELYKNKIINTTYSQMDLMPSILDLFNINHPENKYSRSFIKEIFNQEIKEANIILTQPYLTKYINVVNKKNKYQYDLQNNRVVRYDLSIDPNEENYDIISKSKKDNLIFMQELLPLK